MKRKLRSIGGWIGSGVVLVLAFAGLGLITGIKGFNGFSQSKEEDQNLEVSN